MAIRIVPGNQWDAVYKAPNGYVTVSLLRDGRIIARSSLSSNFPYNDDDYHTYDDDVRDALCAIASSGSVTTLDTFWDIALRDLSNEARRRLGLSCTRGSD